MADITGVTDLNSNSSGADSLAGIQEAVTNLNTDKVDSSRTINGKPLSANITLGLASSDFANQGTATTVLHGNAAGNPSFGAVVEADQTLSDVTTNNVSTTKHGYTPKAPNDATKFLDGTGAWDTIKDSDLSTSDITTNDVSTSKHGFVPKAPNDTTKFLRGDGTWQIPGGGVYKCGVFSKNMSSTTTDTIAHGLGTTPKFVRVTMQYFDGTNLRQSFGVYNGSTTSTVLMGNSGGASTQAPSTDSTNIASYIQSTSISNKAVCSVDGTNITLTWTASGSPTANTAYFMWEAYA